MEFRHRRVLQSKKLVKLGIKNVLWRISGILINEISNLIQEEKNRPKRIWVRKWISRRPTRGASALLLKEICIEDPLEYKMCLRLTPGKFEELLEMVFPQIQKNDSLMRDAIPARIKLEVTLNFLATGNSYRTLQHLFRVPKTSISNCVPEVCEAIYDALSVYIKVSTIILLY